MGERSGVGLVELAVLEALDARRAWHNRRPVSCLKLLLALEDGIGLAPGYTYQVLIDIALPWKLQVPLIEGQGNFGSRGNDPPASAYYTEARLSPAGEVALAAERGDIAPVPIGLINGNTHRQGTRPPFRPAAIIEAIRQVMRRPKLTASQIAAIVGPPDFITGCTVTGDLDALTAGRRTELGLQARVIVTDAAHVSARVAKEAISGHTAPWFVRDQNRPVIIIDKLPPYVSTDDTMFSISNRSDERAWQSRHPELAAQSGLPIGEIMDLTGREDYWFVCVPASGTSPEVLRERLLSVYGVTIYVSVGLPRPLATMIRTWVRTHQHEDLQASLAALEQAIAPAGRTARR